LSKAFVDSRRPSCDEESVQTSELLGDCHDVFSLERGENDLVECIETVLNVEILL